MPLPEVTAEAVEAAPTRGAAPRLDPRTDRPHLIDQLLAGEDIGVSHEMQAILLMQNFAIDEAELRGENAEEIARIMTLEPSVAFSALDKLMEKVGAEKLTAYVTKIPGGHPAFTQERAEKASSKSLEGLEFGSPTHATWLQILGHLHDIKYSILESYLEGSVAREQMHEVARLEYGHFREIAAAVNEFSLVWSQDGGSLMSTEERRAAGMINEVAAIRVVEPETTPRTFEEVPWAQAYPSEIKTIVDLYRKLAGALREKMPTAQGEDLKLLETKATYYETLATAYETSTKAAFLKADTLMPGQSLYRADLPIHSGTIETGYGRDGHVRIPEATLWYPDAEAKDVNEAALILREDMARELKKFLDEGQFPESTYQTVDLVAKTSFMAAHAMGAGMPLYFAAAGQFLPNEPEARFNGGVSVTASLSVAIEREPQFEEASVTLYGQSLGARDVKKKMVHSTGAHEFGHPIGLTQTVGDLPGTNERIPKNFVDTFPEEWKATVGGLVLGGWRLYTSPDAKTKVTLDDLKGLLRERAAGAGRYVKRRIASPMQPYTRKSIMLVKVLEEEGVIVQKGEGWEVDVSDDSKVIAVYKRLERDYAELLHIYGEGDEADLRQFLFTRLQPCAASKYIFAKMDASLPGGVNEGAMTIEQLCALPGEDN